MQSVNSRVSVMFVVSSTAYGISQRLLAYARISDALLRAAVARATETDKSQIYRVGSVDDSRAAVSAVGLGKASLSTPSLKRASSPSRKSG
jgi:hypothetical protein